MLLVIKNENPNLDVLFIAGDIGGHSFPSELGELKLNGEKAMDADGRQLPKEFLEPY